MKKEKIHLKISQLRTMTKMVSTGNFSETLNVLFFQIAKTYVRHVCFDITIANAGRVIQQLNKYFTFGKPPGYNGWIEGDFFILFFIIEFIIIFKKASLSSKQSVEREVIVGIKFF